MQIKVIECVQCRNEFDFTVSQQNYYAKMGFDEPKRCPECRKRKTRLETDANPKLNRKSHRRAAEDEREGFGFF